MEEATGVKGDISLLLKFHWWEPILYQAKGGFPTDSHEKGGTWCGIVWDYGSVTHDSITSLSFTDTKLPLLPYRTKAIMAVLDGNPMVLLSIHTMHFIYKT